MKFADNCGKRSVNKRADVVPWLPMDISYLGKSDFKIKAKTGSVVLSPEKLSISHKSGGEDFIVNQPGEYEVEGISVFGYHAELENIYVIQFDDLRILYLGKLSKSLSESKISELENIDAVMIPVDIMSVKDAVELVSKLEPYYVMPYGEMVQQFISSYEHGSRVVKSLLISKLTLPDDLTEVITFE